MIQRIQTLFLLAATVFTGLIFVFPIWENQGQIQGINTLAWLDAFNLKLTGPEGELMKKEGAWYIAALAALSLISTLFSIFQYRKRTFQYRLGLFNILLLLALFLSYVIGINKAQEWLKSENIGLFRLAFFLPLAALVCNLLANYYIKKDEKLVRSMDRLR